MLALVRCPVLTAAVEHHAAVLDLDVQSTARGLWLRPKPTAPQTVLDAVGRRHPRPTLPSFEAAADECHQRVIARTLALHSIKADRGDSECSRPLIWRLSPTLRGSVGSAACVSRSLLSSVSGGAVKTRHAAVSEPGRPAQTAALTLGPIGFSHPGSPAALPLGPTLTPKNLPS